MHFNLNKRNNESMHGGLALNIENSENRKQSYNLKKKNLIFTNTGGQKMGFKIN